MDGLKFLRNFQKYERECSISVLDLYRIVWTNSNPFVTFSILVHHIVVKPIVWLDHFMLKTLNKGYVNNLVYSGLTHYRGGVAPR